MNKVLLIIPVLMMLIISTGCTTKKEKHLDTQFTFEERAEYIVSKMTLEEKVSQMSYHSPAIERLGIPALNWWNECLHGVARAGLATVFPQAIGMASMWDREQMLSIAEAISDEARAKHHEFASRNKRGIYQGLSFWTPNINIFRDPRWGRGMETYGEDPYLTGELAVPFVKGLQGNDEKYLKLVATAKHFVVHSGPESTRHSFNAEPSEFDLLSTYTPQFEKVIKEGNVYSVMCAYNRFKGLPCCGNKSLNNLLRNDWGFNGYIVSDCWAIRDFYAKGTHEVTSTQQEAAAMSVKAGTDLNCGSSYPSLVEAVKNSLITEKELDVSLERLFVARLKLGLFAPEGDVPFETIPYDVVDSEQHRLLALETARKSIVLLKNENNVLPLSKDLKDIAVIGSNANDLEVLLGNYNGYPSNPTTPLKGIQQKLPNATIHFANGCKLAEGLPVFEAVPSSVLFTDTSCTKSGLKGEYYTNLECEGTPVATRIDPNVDFVWRTNTPTPELTYDHYSVKWTGVIRVPETGKYALGGEAFSGMKLFLDGELLVKREDVHHPRKEYEYVTLEANKPYTIELKYKQKNTEYAIMRLLWEKPNTSLEQEALQAAKKSDVVILCMGISPLLEGEEMKVKVDGFAGGDRENIKLPKSQTELMKKIHKLGKPMVLVLLNGSALAINWENDHIPAIVEAWYPGQAGGTALADVLFGDYNPAGRLPLTFYKSIDDIPAFDNYDMKGKTYRFFEGEPLYEFGYGLSYTQFTYSNLKIADQLKAGQPLHISVDVTNAGQVAGEEVVQVYSKNSGAEGVNPNKNLLEFSRIHLAAQETQTISFTIEPKQLAVVDSQFNKAIKQGTLLVSVGGAQPSDTRIKEKSVLQASIPVLGTKILNN